MAAFVSLIQQPNPAQMLALATGVNDALRGHTATTGSFTLAAGATSVTLTDPRCRAGRLALLIPLNAAAAGLQWWLSSMGQGSMAFSFTTAPASAAQFGYALIGDGTQLES
jgi:hypothetical protein